MERKERWRKEQEEKALKKEERAWRKEQRHLTRSAGGRFYFLLSDGQYKDISPANMARLVYLATFLHIEDGNRLYCTARTPMHKSDLEEVLHLSQASVSRFWAEVSEKYLTVGSDGVLVLSSEFFNCGKTPKDWYGREFQTVYSEFVRDLYQRASSSQHKRLGFIFQLLPFVNFEWNVLCWNPEEPDLDKVRCMTISEFCDQIGYDRGQCNRLAREYSSLKFKVGNGFEALCSFVTHKPGLTRAKMFINPRILYKGSHPDDVRILGAFCKTD